MFVRLVEGVFKVLDKGVVIVGRYLKRCLSLILCLLLILLSLTGCDSNAQSTDVQPTSITIIPKDESVKILDYSDLNTGGSAMAKFPEEYLRKIYQINEISNGRGIRLRRNQTVCLTLDTDPENSSKQATWSSSDEEIAKVDENGKVTTFDKGGYVFIKAEMPDGISNSLAITIPETQEQIVQNFIQNYSEKLDIATKEQAICLKNQILNKANLFKGDLHQQLIDLSKKADEVPDDREDSSNNFYPSVWEESISQDAEYLATKYNFTFFYTTEKRIGGFSDDSDEINSEFNQMQPVTITSLNTTSEVTDLIEDMIHYCFLQRCANPSINAISISAKKINSSQCEIKLYIGKVNENIDSEGGYDFDAFE